MIHTALQMIPNLNDPPTPAFHSDNMLRPHPHVGYRDTVDVAFDAGTLVIPTIQIHVIRDKSIRLSFDTK